MSNASDDLPDPDTPVTTVKVLCGISKSMFLRLWTRAPRTTMLSVDIFTQGRRGIPRAQALYYVQEHSGIFLLYGVEAALLNERRQPCSRSLKLSKRLTSRISGLHAMEGQENVRRVTNNFASRLQSGEEFRLRERAVPAPSLG